MPRPNVLEAVMSFRRYIFGRLIMLAKKILLAVFSSALSLTVSHASTIEAINHTHWTINRFSVDGRSGIDVIGAYQGGGGGCCYIVDEQWHDDMSVKIDWQTGVSAVSALAYEYPGYSDWPKYLDWLQKVDAQNRSHSKIVPVPDYTGQNVCGITVHFLPCDDIQVTTSCHAYGSAEYPIKIPLHLPEPQSCPQVSR